MVASMESSFLVELFGEYLGLLLAGLDDPFLRFLQCNLDLLLGAIDLLENLPLGAGNRSKLRLLGFLLLLGQGIDGESHLLRANLASLGGSIVNVALGLGDVLGGLVCGGYGDGDGSVVVVAVLCQKVIRKPFRNFLPERGLTCTDVFIAHSSLIGSDYIEVTFRNVLSERWPGGGFQVGR